MPNLDKALKKYWGYDSFRPLQREIISSLLDGNDTLALLPTGGGKSLTYQLPAMIRSGICVVVTPLIALMKDQVDNLRSRNIRALCVHSGMSKRIIDQTLDNAVFGNYKFLYVSPERARTRLFRERFARMKVSFLAIDEAHCISQWGYDFRPDYLALHELRAFHPNVPILAVTASATSEVCDDIIQRLSLKDCVQFKQSFARDNLSYLIRYTKDKEEYIYNILNSVRGVAIIYCRLRKECELLSATLSERGYRSSAYHGGMSPEMRTKVQEDWISERTPIIVATNAFGMGIDKSNVRVVIHFDMPDTIEAYYQEAGRAGRDGAAAYAVLLHNPATRRTIEQNLASRYPSIPKIKEIYQQIFTSYQLGIGDGKGLAFDFDITQFCYSYKQFPAIVHSAIEILQINGYLYLSEPSDNPTRVQFRVARDELYHIQIKQKHLNEFIQVVMRLYSGVFSHFVKIDEGYIAKVTGWSLEYINNCFIDIGRLRIINYIPKRRSAIIFMNEERLDDADLRIAPQTYAIRMRQSQQRIEKMYNFVDSEDVCRSVIIQTYFGEQDVKDCGKCDICRARDSKLSPSRRLEGLLQLGKLDIPQIISRTRFTSTLVQQTLDKLLEDNVIEIVDGMYFQIKSQKSLK